MKTTTPTEFLCIPEKAWDREAADAAILEEEARQRADDEDRPRRIAEAQKVVDTFRAEEDRLDLAEGRVIWAPISDEYRYKAILDLDGSEVCDDCGYALSGQPESCPGCGGADDGESRGVEVHMDRGREFFLTLAAHAAVQGSDPAVRADWARQQAAEAAAKTARPRRATTSSAPRPAHCRDAGIAGRFAALELD